MTRKELKDSINNSVFEYQCKVKGNKNHLRYLFRPGDYTYFLIVNYNDNSIKLWSHFDWPNERIESKFDYLYVHELSKEDLVQLFKIFKINLLNSTNEIGS